MNIKAGRGFPSVKKIKSTISNPHLRNERERLGWTRAYVAEKLGLADPKTLGRWERGVSSPNAYFRQKLCNLFGKTSKDLGLIQPISDKHREEETVLPSAVQNTLPSIPTDFLYDPATPSTLAGTVRLIGRDKLLCSLKRRLCSNRHTVYIALHGLPGVGKTTLAVTLAHDHEILTHFHDGVFWARVGPKPDMLGSLSKWGALVGIPVTQMEKLTTCEAWIEVIRTTINTRRILFIIDDVWNIDDALICKVGGLNCAYLITTRFPDVALQFSHGESFIVSELNISDSLTLLACFVPNLVALEYPTTHELARLVGGLPLALTLMGRYLQRQAYSGQPRRVKTSLERLYDAEERLQLKEPQAALECSPSLPAKAPLSLQAVIGASDDHQLDENTRNALYALSIFPAKPDSFAEEAALAVCAMPVEVLDTLMDAGLLEGYSPGRYTLHQTIVDYARTKLRDKSVVERLVVYIANYVQQHEMDYEALGLENNTILVALGIAYEEQMQAELVQISCAFASFLYMRGSYMLAEEILTKAYEASTARGDNRSIIKILFHLGEIMRKRGGYAQTVAYLKEGLNLAIHLEETEWTSILLGRLAVVIELQGNYAQAEAYYLEGLALVRQYGLHEHTSRLLADFGVLAGQQGNYVQAEAYLKEALTLAHQQGLREIETAIFTALGWVVTEQGYYEQAETYLKEGLILAHQINSRERIAGLRWALGMIATDQGNYAQAEAYLKEGLKLAHQLTHLELISELLLKLGIVAIDQGDYTQAETYLLEGLTVARQLGHTKLISDQLQNLGIVAAKRGNGTQATAYLQEGLTVARQIGHCELICALLLHLGERTIIQEDYVQAEEYLQEGLALARQIGHRRRMSMVLSNLGMQATKHGNYRQAEMYLEEGLTLARQLGIPHLVCTLLYNWGECQLNQQQSCAATASFHEMLSYIPEGCQELIANARYSLARIVALQNNISEAQQQGQNSLIIFEKIGHYRANEVRYWLDTLPPLTCHAVKV
jgi:tetratricopeptide (TPR) repeat protein/transcriptional regulator with XRE-family HTH domain